MRNIKMILLTAVMLGLAGAQASGAVSLAGRFSVFGDLGYGGFAMGDFNREIDSANQGFVAGGFNKVDPIRGGVTFGGGVAYGLFENVQIGAEISYLYAQSNYVQPSSGTYTPPSGSTPVYGMPAAAAATPPTFNLYLPALEAGILIRGLLPVSDTFVLSGGIGLDDIYLYGNRKTDIESLNFTGNGLAGKILVGGEGFLSDHFSLGADLGYRMAKVNEIKDSSGRVLKLTSDPSQKLTADFTGVIIQAALRYYF